MRKEKLLTRRSFVSQSLLAGTALLFPVQNFDDYIIPNNTIEHTDLSVFIFSKALQFLDYKSMCEAVKEMGFDGIDLTVRPNGHVLPERVIEDLPKATEAMDLFNLTPQLLSTHVIDANNPIHIKVLHTAGQLGYQYYRTAWIKYTEDRDVLEILENAKQQFKGLTVLNKQHGISAGYQNHSGHFFGASIWDLYQVLENMPPKQIGSQYDVMHACVEGGKNWEIGFKLIKPYINSVVVKDFLWSRKNDKWIPKYTPLGEGMVDFKRFFTLLKKYKINVPISIHTEYDLGGAEHGEHPTIDKKEVFRRIKMDLDFIRRTWKEVN